MSDIVERLRSDYRSCGFCRLDRKEGANEIERLRAALRSIADIDDDYSETYRDLRRMGGIAREALGDEG